MAKMGITLDGRNYKIWVVYDSVERNFEFIGGPHGSISVVGGDILDTLGTKYNYELRAIPDPQHRTDYDEFFMAISNPQRIHTIVMPFGQSTISFQCKINSGGDVFHGNEGDKKLWTGLKVSISPIKPQR